MSEPSLYLFDGSNLFHAGGFRAPRRARRPARELRGRPRRPRRRRLRRRRGGPRRSGRSSVRFAPHADAVLERLAAEHRERGGGAARHVGCRRAGNERAGGEEARFGRVSRRARGGRRIARTRRAGSAIASTSETAARLERSAARRRLAPRLPPMRAPSCRFAARSVPAVAAPATHEHLFLLQWNLRKGVVTLARSC